MKNYCLAALSLLLCCSPACVNQPSKTAENNTTKKELQLKEAWSSDSVLTPESVLWIPEARFFYVSEIGKDKGNGAIGKVDGDGKIISADWAKGLDAPKGMGIYKDTLFVADVKQLVLIDRKNGHIIKKIELPGAVFLNDVVAGKDGSIYISDTREGKVYIYKEGQTAVYLQQAETKGVNGLLIKDNILWMLTGDGIYTCNLTTKSVQLFSEEVKGGDGITFINDSSMIASRWAGEVFAVNKQGHARQLLDLTSSGTNTADLHFVPTLQLLVIPTFKGQRIKAYRLE